MRLVSLAMYASPPPLAEATAKLWAFLRDALRADGVADVPEALDETLRYDESWRHPDLLLAQTCGYPYVRHLRAKVRLVATPVYAHPGCDGPSTSSFIAVHRDSAATSLEDLRGSRAAINEPDSNSGANLFRAAIAPLAEGGRFFGSVLETGGHRASLEAIATGKADVAAIDCVTFGNVLRFDPETLASIRVLAQTAKGPGLPLITRAGASDAEVSALRRALAAAIADPALADTRDTLALKDFAILSDADYQPLADMEATARRLGYPAIA
ncbi:MULTISPECIES: phosphate/phosphite/phosphonate ABC transporter substrate-binding protein [unclassified Aureimonas]|uniref:phosphate/phosphite/phosphonate ABC transporter substrate-binding protein n=1 Tax=unclassified Aureimonas TaxID=2615206 RepID=UPI0006FDDD15|nr:MULTISPECIES: PhnD/SsuA/transferrin family substrate-binding protein [unclassified Aureimonas]KQT63991.1 phosphate ABC transporter substrate-binding protein [Aureimonas sp. Leaf427]KQT81184.1 phosphate ABC transporter substrate-binding protein [Aureimonas sp. Leaf460]